VRGGGASSVARSVSSTEAPRRAPRDLLAFPVGPDVERPVSSDIVFQSPQPSQRPDHLFELTPQAEQVNVVVYFAMSLMCLTGEAASKPNCQIIQQLLAIR
jgi:hypothetical protein